MVDPDLTLRPGSRPLAIAAIQDHVFYLYTEPPTHQVSLSSHFDHGRTCYCGDLVPTDVSKVCIAGGFMVLHSPHTCHAFDVQPLLFPPTQAASIPAQNSAGLLQSTSAKSKMEVSLLMCMNHSL